MVNSLIVSNLSKRYGRRLVVNDLSFSMRAGEIVGLLGPNGAGKTTTFYMIVGFLKARKGSIILNGEDVTELPMHERSKKGLSYLPQEPSIFRKLSVRDNILLVAQSRNDLTRHEKHRLVDELVEEFGLTAVVSQKGYTLSGGERRRCDRPRASLRVRRFAPDEPFAGIDPKAVYEIKLLIKKLANQESAFS